jgi:septal ring-binding cell division protein DamX
VKRVLLFGALWLAATAATGAVAWGAVRLAGEQTAEQAVRPMTARQVEALAASSTTATTGTTRPATASTSSTSPAVGTTSPAGASTTTAAPAVVARQTRGGTVMVSLQGGGLSLVSATPAAGFAVEVEEVGPDEVVVVFEGPEDDEVRVRAVVASGEVEFSVESGGERG